MDENELENYFEFNPIINERVYEKVSKYSVILEISSGKENEERLILPLKYFLWSYIEKQNPFREEENYAEINEFCLEVIREIYEDDFTSIKYYRQKEKFFYFSEQSFTNYIILKFFKNEKMK